MGWPLWDEKDEDGRVGEVGDDGEAADECRSGMAMGGPVRGRSVSCVGRGGSSFSSSVSSRTTSVRLGVPRPEREADECADERWDEYDCDRADGERPRDVPRDPGPLDRLALDAFALPLRGVDRATDTDEADLGIRLPSGVACDMETVGASGWRAVAGARLVDGLALELALADVRVAVRVGMRLAGDAGARLGEPNVPVEDGPIRGEGVFGPFASRAAEPERGMGGVDVREGPASVLLDVPVLRIPIADGFCGLEVDSAESDDRAPAWG